MALTFDRSLDVPPGVAVQLSPLVTRVLAPNPGPFTFKGTGVYLVGHGEAVVVIDPGPDLPAHVAALKQAIGSRHVSHILITHTHRDHSPAAAPLKAWSGASIYAAAGPPPPHAGEVPVASPAMRKAEGGKVDEAHDHAFAPDHILQDGDAIAADGFSFTAVATPGHTANHMCYALVEEQALFSGDHVMGWSTSVIAPPDGDMAAYRASLQTLIARNDRILYPTHGSPIADPQSYLRGLADHRAARERQVLDGLSSGDTSVTQLTRRLYPTIDPMLSAAAATQVQAHLDELVARGAVTRDGVTFRRAS